MNEKEFVIKIVNGKPVFDDGILEFFKSTNLGSYRIKIYPDFEEIYKLENISKKVVEKIAKTQKIPLDVALGVVRSKGKIKK